MHVNIETIARQGGALALDHFKKLSTIPVESKGHLDLVTRADKEVESLVSAQLHELYPEDGIFGEEGNSVGGKSGRTWVIDPIDGTLNFVRGGDQWAVSIGLYERGEPVFGVIHAPVCGHTLVGGSGVPAELNGARLPMRAGLDHQKASIGVGFSPSIPTQARLDLLQYVIDEARMTFRCFGSATMSMLAVARGELDGYIGLGESSWDLMAGLPILKQLGVESTVNWSRVSLSSKLKFACGTPELLELVAPIMPYGSVLEP